MKEVAKELRMSVQNGFENFQNLHWPPSFDYLSNSDILPEKLTNFLNILLAGKTSGLSTQKNRIISSIGQDICRSITNSQWKLPKHILLCMTLRHLFRSKELLTLLNRFGHCEGHSFSLELETTVARAVESSSSLVSSQIIRRPLGPSVFHSEFDNFDQFVNDLSGKGSVHTAHGIMLQEVTTTQEESSYQTPQVPKD